MRVQKAKNPNNPTGFEQMHLPWIIIPEFVKRGDKVKVIVKVGKVYHPMENEHYVSYITLFINGEKIKKKELELIERSEAEFTISLAKDSVISARQECNLHGIWETEKKVILFRDGRK